MGKEGGGRKNFAVRIVSVPLTLVLRGVAAEATKGMRRTAGARLLRHKRQAEKDRPEGSIAFGAESSLCAKKYIRFCNTYQNMGQKNRKIR